jgi:hypothetical protein
VQERTYEKPSIVDYGSLADLTAMNGQSDSSDGLGFINIDGSSLHL